MRFERITHRVEKGRHRRRSSATSSVNQLPYCVLLSQVCGEVCQRVITMHSVFKKLPDLSYRSHKLHSGTAGDRTRNLESFDIRPPYLDRGFMDPSKWLTTTTSSGYSTTTTISTGNSNKNNHNTHGSSNRTAMPTSSELTVTGVTGIPNLVELDDAFNTLDPGQLLRESAAAATRAALLSEPLRAATALPADAAIRASTERRRKSSHLVDDLLQQIYHPQTSFDDDDDDDETFAGESTDDLPGAHPLKRKGNSNPIRLDSLVTHPDARIAPPRPHGLHSGAYITYQMHRVVGTSWARSQTMSRTLFPLG